VSDLYGATIVPIPKWEAPYGFLALTSLKAELSEWVLLLDEISVDCNGGVFRLWVFFSLENISSSGEEVVGFQVPYSAEIREMNGERFRSNLQIEKLWR